MKKYLFIIFILSILDIFSFKYFKDINSKIKTFNFENDNSAILIQTKDIELDSIDNFNFNQLFKVYALSDYSLKHTFDDEYLSINLDNTEYKFNYKIIEPEVIEKVVYKEIEREVEQNIQEPVYEDYFYVDSYELCFELDTDLDEIRNALYENVNTTYQTSIDYSRLNVSQIGQYSVFYTTNDEKIEIFVKIG